MFLIDKYCTKNAIFTLHKKQSLSYTHLLFSGDVVLTLYVDQ
jgi:hypothetical protein